MKIYHSLPAICLILFATFPVAPSIADEETNSIQGEKNNRSERYKNLNRRQQPLLSTPKVQSNPKEQSTPINSKQSWSGVVKIELRKEAPRKGYVTNNVEWSKLWTTYRGSEALPNVDFDREIVLVYVHRDPNAVGLSLSLSAAGNLTIETTMTLMGYNNPTKCSYKFVLIDRAGIKAIKGLPISNH
ncbi:hypothetical protein [Chamaesiphon sp. VAR_48_metabat_135_sub]|uniref:hypothetical protein n=1 Tax=Chamaesiphon sp. VAR_48_metabat_135_sub TaxID=2964699 RepID=UPI00286B2F55|nr:hypothetical protein [Chamaesiphon sp. VAR_48_metabat_135_sub]